MRLLYLFLTLSILIIPHVNAENNGIIYFSLIEGGNKVTLYSIEKDGVYLLHRLISNSTVPYSNANLLKFSNSLNIVSIKKNLKLEFISLPDFSIKWEYGFPKEFDTKKSEVLSINQGNFVLIWNQLLMGSTGNELILLDKSGNLIQSWSYPFDYVKYRGPDSVKAIDVDNDGYDELFLLFGTSMWNQTRLNGAFHLVRMDWNGTSYENTWITSLSIAEKNSVMEIVQYQGKTYIVTAGENDSPIRVFLDNGNMLWSSPPFKDSPAQKSPPYISFTLKNGIPLLNYYPQTVFENVPLSISTFNLLDGSRIAPLFSFPNTLQLVPVKFNSTTNRVFVSFSNGTKRTYLHTPMRSLIPEKEGIHIENFRYLRSKMVAVSRFMERTALFFENNSYWIPQVDLDTLNAFDVLMASGNIFPEKKLVLSYKSTINPLSIFGWFLLLIFILGMGVVIYFKYIEDVKFWKKWPIAFIRSMNRVQKQSAPPTSTAIVLPSEKTDIQPIFRNPLTVELYTKIHQIEPSSWNEFRKEMGIKLKLIDIFILTEVLDYPSDTCPRPYLKKKLGQGVYRRIKILTDFDLLTIVKTTTSSGAIKEEVKISYKGEQLLVFLYKILEYGMYGNTTENEEKFQ